MNHPTDNEWPTRKTAAQDGPNVDIVESCHLPPPRAFLLIRTAIVEIEAQAKASAYRPAQECHYQRGKPAAGHFPGYPHPPRRADGGKPSTTGGGALVLTEYRRAGGRGPGKQLMRSSPASMERARFRRPSFPGGPIRSRGHVPWQVAAAAAVQRCRAASRWKGNASPAEGPR